MERFIESLQGVLVVQIPVVLGALVLILIGWLAAIAVKLILKKTLRLCKLNDVVQTKGGKASLDLESGIAKGGYYIVLLFVLLAVFNQLGLVVAAQPIQAFISQILGYIPNLFGGGVLIFVAWICATILKQVVTGVLAATTLDSHVKGQKKSLSQTFGEIAFWLVFLIFLPGIVGVFGLQGLLLPTQAMTDKILAILPNLLGAGVIVFSGWLIAKIIREIVTNILAVSGLDPWGEKVGISGTQKLSGLVGVTLYVLILVPAIVAGLNALGIEAIARPAAQMLNTFMAAVPQLLAALALLAVTYVIAKPLTRFISGLLASLGFDRIPQKLGYQQANSAGTPLSRFAGNAVFFFMMLFAGVEAANRMGLRQVAEWVAAFILFGSKILVGSVVMAVGLWLANLFAAAINRASGEGHKALAGFVRAIILVLVITMGLSAMGIANEIVNLAFGLTLGAIAVAFALSFGIGGREAAGRQMEYWLSKLRGEGKAGK